MRIWKLIPGAALCVAIGLVARVLDAVQRATAGRAWLEALVLALLLGAVVRWVWTPSGVWEPGIDFAARPLLELAVVLLGLSVDLPLLARAGPALALGIVVVVALGLVSSFVLAVLPEALRESLGWSNEAQGDDGVAEKSGKTKPSKEIKVEAVRAVVHRLAL